MGKKKPEEMAQHRGLFVEGAQKKGYATDLANKLFDLMAMFAEYGFNKSHTAAYAVVTYQTAWLKAHHPAEFFAATLSADMDDTDKVQLFVNDAKANGIEILPPDVNASALRFEPVSERAVRYGLGAVKGSGSSAVACIVETRAQAPYRDLFDFCARVDRKVVNRRAIEALVRAGAFDSTDPDRAKLLANVGKAIDAAEAREAAANQVSLFDAGDGSGDAPIEWQAAAPWSERQRLQEEKSALGFFLSGHLFRGFEAEVRRFARTRLADLQPAPQPQWIAGIVASQRTQMTRRGKMSVVMLDDGSASLEVSVYNEVFERHRALIRDDELLVILAKVSRDDYSGGQRVIAERVLDLTGARQEFGKRIRIRLNGVAEAGALRKVIQPFVAGGQPEDPAMPVIVEYGNACARCAVELGADWRVRPQEDLIAEVRQRLHAQAVAIEY
jgi:DNA polymerase-3 subunit alpha